METKPLLYGLIGFFIGGFIVSVAATTFDTPSEQSNEQSAMTASMQMSTDDLKGRTGDDFDRAFLVEMIAHHEGALAMAKLSRTNAKHEDIKQLSNEIVAAQEKEISQMKQWQTDWGYPVLNENDGHSTAHQ